MPEIFTRSYINRREEVMPQLAGELSSKYYPADLSRLVVPEQSPYDFQRAYGNNLPAESSVRLLLGNVRELVTPGHHYERQAGESGNGKEHVEKLVRNTFDAFYAMNYLALKTGAELYGESVQEDGLEERAFANAVHAIARLPEIIDMHRWNVFAHLKDPAVWSEGVRGHLSVSEQRVGELKFSGSIDGAIKDGNRNLFVDFLKQHGLERAYPLHLENIDTNYDGPKAILWYYIANQLSTPATNPQFEQFAPSPVYYLPEAVHRATRELGFDAHPEAKLGYAIFLDHLRGTVVLGQTGVGGNGLHFYGGGIVLGGLSDRAVPRHPRLGNYVKIGTGTKFFGPMIIGDYTQVGVDSQLIGRIEFEGNNTVGNWVRIGSYSSGGNGYNHRPGKITFAEGVRVGDHTLIINTDPDELSIPKDFPIPADSFVFGVNGKPTHKESHRGDTNRRSLEDAVSDAERRTDN